ncbi:MAG: DUF4136 domain-containing protein [Candidatus Omnitrophica bacterium]|nr:DUF4136 domain-containing protein [Candidatus Omnitrophota bacterium]
MKKTLFLILSLMFLSGCATYYPVRVNDYLNATRTSISLHPGASVFVLENKNERNPIFDAEIKSKIERLLAEKGYRIASSDSADLYISFTYSISSGNSTTEVRPVYNPGDTETIQTSKSNGKTSTSIVTLPGYTTYVPYRVTVYTSTLILNVLDAKSLRDANERQILWIGENSTTGENPVLRETINYLLVAAFLHFGESTGKSIIANISENDPRIKGFYGKVY